MAIIRGKALKEARDKRRLTQDELSRRTKPRVVVSTISRIEREKTTRVRSATLRNLAKALDVQPEALCPPPEVDRDVIKLHITPNARNALHLVALRYDIDREDVVGLAPLLFFIAAERSLQERKKRIDALRTTMNSLVKLYSRIPHPLVNEYPLLNKESELTVREEECSIDERGLFGDTYDNDEFDLATQNPFVSFLRTSLADATGSLPGALRDALVNSVRWRPESSPSYAICIEEAADLVGGDTKALAAVIPGLAALHEMPKGSVEENAAWARAEFDLAVEKLRGPARSPSDRIASEARDWAAVILDLCALHAMPKESAEENSDGPAPSPSEDHSSKSGEAS